MSAAVEFEKQEVQRLIALMKSPGYWRDRDPEVLRAVRTGFQRLYGKSAKPPPPASRTEVRDDRLRPGRRPLSEDETATAA